MITKMMIMGVLTLAVTGTAPVLAQTNGGAGQSDPMQSGAMQGGAMQNTPTQPNAMQPDPMQNGPTAPETSKMTKSQMRSMKKCQAMAPDMMAKNKTCSKMMAMHPEMNSAPM